MEPAAIDPGMTVDEIMRRWPGTIRVFIGHRMLCIGCPIGIFHTVADACAAHDLDEESFSRELLAAVQGDIRSNGGSAFDAAGVQEQGRLRKRSRRPISSGGSQPPA